MVGIFALSQPPQHKYYLVSNSSWPVQCHNKTYKLCAQWSCQCNNGKRINWIWCSMTWIFPEQTDECWHEISWDIYVLHLMQGDKQIWNISSNISWWLHFFVKWDVILQSEIRIASLKVSTPFWILIAGSYPSNKLAKYLCSNRGKQKWHIPFMGKWRGIITYYFLKLPLIMDTKIPLPCIIFTEMATVHDDRVPNILFFLIASLKNNIYVYIKVLEQGWHRKRWKITVKRISMKKFPSQSEPLFAQIYCILFGIY